jgi:outer membrane protein OmpU
MKNLLLATTMLVGTAGFAAAEGHITFGGSAAAGIARDTDLGDFDVYSSAGLDVTFAGSTDNGLEFGATFDVSVGTAYEFADDDGFSTNDGIFGAPEIFVSGSWGRVAFKHDGYGFFHNDDDGTDQADVDYSGTFSGFTVGVRADVNDLGGANPNDLSATLGYTIAGVSLTANIDGTDTTEWDVSAAYTMGAFTGTLSYDVDEVAGLEVAYAGNGISASASYNTDEEIDVSVGYAANSISVDASYGTDSDNATDDTYEVTAGYDLGGGLSLKAGYNYTGDAFVGAEMSF